jgi:predicted nucleotidyltransferase
MIVYGVESALKVSAALRRHFEEGKRFKRYDIEQLKVRFRERCRDSGISFEDYAYHEQRKSFEGFFGGTEFFVRYVKDQDKSEEVYGENLYTPFGRAQISGTVEDVSEAIFTPCFYGLKDIKIILGKAVKPILGIASFRGRFCQQALIGEQIMASGKLERVLQKGGDVYFRLIVGNRPEDFMVIVR